MTKRDLRDGRSVCYGMLWDFVGHCIVVSLFVCLFVCLFD